ncbi:8890_t:CDS:2 [Paraglomus occultum]|uniref:chitin synthase n=1 Tax=Paraglomus occultum TaxID=144539 RepID=A0A9N8YY79_9GLOM|nr:8890_t:CDS:2 [Paraglomus occultum]
MPKKKSRTTNRPASGIPTDDRVDLTQLLASANSSTSDEEVVQLLGARHRADCPYTRISASCLVTVNPYKPLECMNDVNAKEYAEQWYKDTSGNKTNLQPHIYELAARIYLHMRRSAEDQSVIFSGITGSGKTASHNHLIQQLLLLSTHTKKESKISNQIENAQIILEAFGNAKTVQNNNASRYGKYTELQFNERGRIIGTKFLTYGFDKPRVTSVPQDERTYHVFYYLLAGATSEEKSQLRLQDPSSYHYLSQSKCYKIGDVNDSIKMDELRDALRTLKFKPRTISRIWQLLTGILLLGNVEFVDPGKNAKDEAAAIKNHHVLESAAGLLGVPPAKLQSTLTYRAKFIRKELCTVFLNAEAAAEQRDGLARVLYSILFTWIVEHINSKLIQSDEPPNFIGLLDQPGYQNFASNGFEQFTANFATEEIENFVVKNIFDDLYGENAELKNDGVSVRRIMTMDNKECVKLLRGDPPKSSKKPGGLIGILDQECAKVQSGKETVTDSQLLAAFQKTYSSHPSYVAKPSTSKFSSKAGAFGISHFTGQVTYSVDQFMDKNLDTLSPDFVNLFRDTTNPFINKLFSGPALSIENHPRSDKTVVMAQLQTKPMRSPSMKKPKKKVESESEKVDDGSSKRQSGVSTVTTQLYQTLNQLLETFAETRLWNVFQIRPNDSQEPDNYDAKKVKAQVRSFLIPDITARLKTSYTAHYTFEDFLARYESILAPLNLEPSRSDAQKVETFATISGWDQSSIALGRSMVFLSDSVWKELEDSLRASEKEERAKAKALRDDDSQASGFDGDERYLRSVPKGGSRSRLLPKFAGADYLDDQGSHVGSEDEYNSRSGGTGTQYGGDEDEGSLWGVGYTHDIGKADEKAVETHEEIEELPVTRIRIWWVRFVWLMTWWIPSFMLTYIGKMKRPDIRMAWREKFTLCILIFLLSAVIIFYIVFFGHLICAGDDKVYSQNEVGFHTGDTDWWVSFRGSVFDLSNFWQSSIGHSDVLGQPAAKANMEPYGGQDVSPYFPLPLSTTCAGLDFGQNPDTVVLTQNISNIVPNAFFHQFGSKNIYAGSKLASPDWYTNNFLPRMKTMYKARLVWSRKDVLEQGQGENPRLWAIIHEGVYDLTQYFATQNSVGQTSRPANGPNYHYLSDSVETLFKSFPGQDLTSRFNKAFNTQEDYQNNLNCLQQIFYIGGIDFRKSFRCQFNNYMLLTFSCMLFAVIGVKFLAALQLGSRRKPEDHDKFVICQVPCYTEGEDSLRRTMDSLAALTYDDKRKLIFLICDGMIVGSGNDRPTPTIVLDILGVDPRMDPEPLSFKSVGEGSAQLNYGKVYSGLYEYEGHVVPYIVVVKVGKPSEQSRPGNRGKRDSQIILMRFLNKVHFDLEMYPLELEIYHQMKNVIGVNPSFYEYILMVDADTEVMPDSLNRMISCMLHDARIIGICGETTLINEEGSWTTMIQVYEYYISHHLAKAFESLFGSVTCLPGCFCMYRIRTPTKNTPLIISNHVIEGYSENHVDTLHKKNLLSLGEDRYLTTLMMKHFPQYKMTFTPDAMSRTAAPDKWSVLLSQRRRWINSTVHNLMELMFLSEMCGFCCFSMRFVVFIDLFGTLILPSTVVYIIYLIWSVATERQALPIISLVMIAAVYGLQAVIFILKRQWQHIGWMCIYLLAFPLFSFFIPVYAFWHFDDFSWGNTRVVVGEGGKKQIITTDDEKFDEKSIPKKKWADYEQEIWEVGTTGSHESGVSRGSAASYRSRGSHRNYEPSYAGSAYGGSQYGGGSDYFRDTNLAAPERTRGRSRSPVPKYEQSEVRNSRAFSAVGDYYSEPRSSMIVPRNQDMEFYGAQVNRLSAYSAALSDGPSDEEVLAEIRNILATANLMSITKKQVREQLTATFNTDMSSRKEFINNSIELILQGKL